LPRERGTCRNFTIQWFFDTEYCGCSRFWYGGCEGNNNRFESEDECKNSCVAPPGRGLFLLCCICCVCLTLRSTRYFCIFRSTCVASFLHDYCILDACYLPKISGPCEGYKPTWHYDSERKSCTQFVYGGCLGNNNKFETREECQQLCAHQELRGTTESEINFSAYLKFIPVAV
jgi:papilin